MNKKVWSLLIIAVTLLLILSACQRSASTGAVGTPSATSEFPLPLPATQDGNQLNLIATQTANAAGQGKDLATPTLAEVTQAPLNTPEPTATKVVVPTATPGHPATYTLQKGEFPYCIARRFNVNVADLLALNGLTVNSRPAVGVSLKIPQSGTWSNGSRSLKTHPTTYTVQSGDTIYTVACTFGDVDPNAIIAANGLQSPYTLTAGKTIQIP